MTCPSILFAGRVKGFRFVAPPQAALGYRENSFALEGQFLESDRNRKPDNLEFFADQITRSRERWKKRMQFKMFPPGANSAKWLL